MICPKCGDVIMQAIAYDEDNNRSTGSRTACLGCETAAEIHECQICKGPCQGH